MNFLNRISHLSLYIVAIACVVSCAKVQKRKSYDADLDKTLDLIKDTKTNYSIQNTKSTVFKDVSESYGLSGLVANNFNVVDFNQDGHSDLVIIPEYYAQPRFYLYDPKYKKFNLTQSPLPKKVKATFLVFNDINKDGVLDVIVGVLNQKTELEKNPVRLFYGKKKSNKLHFDKELSVYKMSSPSSGVNLIDYDLDGDLDIFISNWFGLYKGKPLASRDIFLENVNGKFEDKTPLLIGSLDKNVSKKMFVNAKPTIGSQICDIDQNGYPDILTASSSGYPNSLWMNLFKFRKDYRYFKDYGLLSRFSGDTVGRLTQTGGGRTFSVVCSDYNDDGIMDVFTGELSHSYDSENKDKSSILTGSKKGIPPLFFRTEYVLDANDIHWTQADKRGVWFDYNNDGLVDLLVDNSGYPPHTRLLLFKQYQDHSFENISKRAGVDFVNPHNSVVLDFNNDGKLDILTARSSLRDANIERRIYLFENTLKNKNRFLKIFLKGKKSNANGIGAMIMMKVKTSKGKIKLKRKYVNFSYGQNSPQNANYTHFGLAEKDELIYLKVRWPYSKNLNANPSSMEKTYKLFVPKEGGRVVTICEDKGIC